jgi:hypothetical protein
MTRWSAIAMNHEQSRPSLNIALAVHRYAADTTLTLATAAALAGVSLERMEDELVARGVEPRLGPATIAEARAEFAALKRSLDARTAEERAE